MIRKIAAAAVAIVVGMSAASSSFAGTHGASATVDTRDEVKVTPNGRSTVYTHIVRKVARADRPYALTGSRPDRQQKYQEIRVGSRIVALQPVND